MVLHGLGDDVELELRLAQTIAWCDPRADLAEPRESLRHDQLRPSVIAVSRADTVHQVAEGRVNWDRAAREAVPVRTDNRLGEGRMLVLFPDEQLADGAAEVETGGFFDVENVPPWDTWVGLYADQERGDHLISWVPQSLVELVGRGIWANPEESILWLADSQVPVAQELRSRGLLR